MAQSAISSARARRALAILIGIAASGLPFAPALAGEADVLAVRAEKQGPERWYFSVTITHADRGWDHYADRFEIVAPDGSVLATRVLAHPHVDEQPFTRSIANVRVPSGIRTVTVRAGDKVHGLGGKTRDIPLDN